MDNFSPDSMKQIVLMMSWACVRFCQKLSCQVSIDSKDTPPKTNMEPKNKGLEDDFPFQREDFPVLC